MIPLKITQMQKLNQSLVIHNFQIIQKHKIIKKSLNISPNLITKQLDNSK